MLGETDFNTLNHMLTDQGTVDATTYLDIESRYKQDPEALTQLKQKFLPFCPVLQVHMQERSHKRAKRGRQGRINRTLLKWLDDNM